MTERIGVYICQCGSNISDYVDVEAVRAAVEQVDGVALAKVTMFACADSTQQEIVQDIEEQRLDGMVVASCSPKLHLFTFRNVAERAGINRYNYVQANIREQGSWAHSDTPAEATAKAIRTVKAAISRALLSEPLEPARISSETAILVVGAGVSGMQTAIALADAGSRVFLVERDHFVGGRTAQWGELFPTGETGASVASGLYGRIEERDDIELLTGCEIVSASGSVGNFEVRLQTTPRGLAPGARGEEDDDGFEERLARAIDACPVVVPDPFEFGLGERKALYSRGGGSPSLPVVDREHCTRCGACVEICPEIDPGLEEEFRDIRAGAVVIATGFDPYEPAEGEFGYGRIPNVITLQQFERLLATGGDSLAFNGRAVRNIAYIFCVGSRQDEAVEGVNTYCSRYCCAAAIHAGLVARRRFGDVLNYHVTRGVRTYGTTEEIYEESSKLGDIYLQTADDDPPVVTGSNGTATVTARDLLTGGAELEIEADLVVLVTGMVPRADDRIGAILKAPAGRDGFFNEVHPKLKPVETVIDGVFLSGAAQGPKNIVEAVTAARSAAVKAHALVRTGEIELEPTMAKIDPTICEWCGACAEACPFDAIAETSRDGATIAVVDESICKGCGMCLPVCPVNAIQLIGYTDGEIEAMIDAMAE
ncbi:MAG: CoB--CoM heterodisulfide reductase iron-sulfur subunit A family protein [Candidatus Krumholzibacteriota bacterium]|nr:CoB--CoM heterodisulfide reductase iron-sulfur subunit A family protein [Candidatus Krumholzibacteriota bacterium]